jgi:predicted nucleic acid-binding protein
VTTWLIDKSALVRLAESPDAAEWAARIERGLVRITTVTRLETGYSARSGSQMRAGFLRPPLSSMPVEYLTPAIEDRAVELLTLFADRGQHRAPSIPDLIIAATAELAGLTLLHLDKDFDLIAGITGQFTERLNMDSAAEIGDDAEQTEALSFAHSGRYGSGRPVRKRIPAAAAHRRAGRQHPRAQRHRCATSTDDRTVGTRCVGVIRRAGPRTGPRPRRRHLVTLVSTGPVLRACGGAGVSRRSRP